jgi:hypothetical protein
MGITPERFGKYYWEVLFLSAANAIDLRRKQVFKSLVLTMAAPGGLPCNDCTNHFNKMIHARGFTIDEYMNNNESLVYVVWLWKSMVNKRLGKPNLPWNVVRDKYISDDDVCDTKCGI